MSGVGRNRRGGSIAGNPLLIGAATALVVVVAVYLAYNANRGLPFVPSYTLTAEVPNAANLVKGNDVRIGGSRVGTVNDIRPLRHGSGSVTALLELKLERKASPLPADSKLIVRPRSALGLKYVEIAKGSSSDDLPDGGRIPIDNAKPEPVEIDEVFNTFNRPTRDASQTNLKEFGNALAGRGSDLNRAVGDFVPLLTVLEPVMANLSDPDTGLRNFFAELGDAAAAVAPVAQTQGKLFVNLSTTFSAFAEVARPYIQDAIASAPESLDAGIRSFPAQRLFLRDAELLAAELQPGIRALRTSAPSLADAVQLGVPTFRRAVGLNRRLKSTFTALEDFSNDPLVPIGLEDLTDTADALDPTLAFATPSQTVCNYVSLFFRNAASVLSEGDSNGTWQRFMVIALPEGPNNEGSPASAPANGPGVANHLHVNPYPNTAAPGQTKECEAGNESYDSGKTVIGNDAGNQGVRTDDQKEEK